MEQIRGNAIKTAFLISIILGLLLLLNRISLADEITYHWGRTTEPVETYTDLVYPGDWKGKIVLQIKKIMNFIAEDENKPILGAGGFSFKVYDKNSGTEIANVNIDDETGEQEIEIDYESVVTFWTELKGPDRTTRVFCIEEVKDSPNHAGVTQDGRIVEAHILSRRSYDNNERIFHVEYKKKKKNNENERDYISYAIFNNEYKTEPSGVEARIKIKKTIDGRGIVGGQYGEKFTFTIRGVEGAPLGNRDIEKLTITLSGDEGKEYAHYEKEVLLASYSLDDLIETTGKVKHYVKQKVFKYIISESDNGLWAGVTQADPQYVAICLENIRTEGKLAAYVIECDKDTGEIHKDADGNYIIVVGNTFEFKNTYKPESRTVSLAVTKIFDDWDQFENETFTIGLYDKDRQLIGSASASKDNPNIIFNVSITGFGVFPYYVQEVVETEKENIFYDKDPHGIIVYVKPSASELDVRVVYEGDETKEKVEIKNDIKNTSLELEVHVKAKKVLEHVQFYPGEFSFLLEETNADWSSKSGGDRHVVSNALAGAIEFTLKCKNNETHYYIMSEIQGKLPHIKYSDEQYRFKIVCDADTYTVYKVDNDGSESPYDGTTPVVFTNIAQADNGEETISIEKVLDGRDWKESDKFEFQLLPSEADKDIIRTSDGVKSSLTVYATKDKPDVSFPNLIYTLEDLRGESSQVFKYKIKEIPNADIKGIKYDTEEKVIEIRVRYRTALGEIEALGGKTLVFRNKYEIHDQKDARPGVYKKIENRPWKKGDSFSFVITPVRADIAGHGSLPVEKMPMPEKDTIQITYDSSDVSGQKGVKCEYFDNIQFTQPGIYSYHIDEIIPEIPASDMEYDKLTYAVEIKVDDNLDGTLKEPVVTYVFNGNDTPSVFVNKYTNEKVVILYPFYFIKKWSGTPTDDVSFDLYYSDGTIRGRHRPIITELDDKTWKIEYWLSAPPENYYVIENNPKDYVPVYQNTDKFKEINDRIYNGGTITNVQVPATGDRSLINLLFMISAIGVTGILMIIIIAGNKRRG